MTCRERLLGVRPQERQPDEAELHLPRPHVLLDDPRESLHLVLPADRALEILELDERDRRVLGPEDRALLGDPVEQRRRCDRASSRSCRCRRPPPRRRRLAPTSAMTTTAAAPAAIRRFRLPPSFGGRCCSWLGRHRVSLPALGSASASQRDGDAEDVERPAVLGGRLERNDRHRPFGSGSASSCRTCPSFPFRRSPS